MRILSLVYIICLSLICCLTMLIGQTANAQSSWKSPSYQPMAYKKIVVLAKISEETARRFMEDAMVAALQKKGYTAIQSYSNFSQEDLASYDALVKRADSLEVDALVLFSGEKLETEYKNSPQVSANVGVPVRVGFMHVYMGTSVPLGGGSNTKKTVKLKSSFYNKSSKDALWSMIVSEKMRDDIGLVAKKIAGTAVETLKKDKILQ